MDIVTPMGPKTKVALKNARTKKVQSTPLDKKWMITTVRRQVPLVIRVWVPFHVFPLLKYIEFFIIMTENGNKKWWKIKIVNKLLKISRFCCLWKISRHGSLDHTFVFGFFSFFDPGAYILYLFRLPAWYTAGDVWTRFTVIRIIQKFRTFSLSHEL